MKKFTGAVKPFFSLDGLGITIRYGEVVSLEEWQINHSSFKFAAENGWVVAVDRKTLVFNPVSSPKSTPQVAAKSPKFKKFSTESEVSKLPENGVDPTLIHKILERQDVFVKQAQKTFDRLTQKKDPEPTVNPELLASLLENQKKMMEMLEREKAAKAPPPPPTVQPDQATLMQALKLLTNEVKKLQESKPVEPSVDTNQLLEGVKQVMSQFSPGTGGYNPNKPDANGFKIRDDFEEKFVPKVEDFEVKTSKIVTQEKDSGSVEDALAALRKLKEKK